MKTLGRAAIGALLGFQALSPIPASAQEGSSSSGGTAVKVDGSVVTITVTIDLFIGGVGTTELPEGAQEVAGTMASDIESFWNQAFARNGTDCLELRLDVILNALPTTMPPPSILYLGENRPAAFVTKPGHHVIFWGEGNAYGNIPPPETYDPYDDDGVSPPGEDYGSPFDHELWAMWSPYLEDSRDLAHEFGHLLGLGDDYYANGEPLPGRKGTLMADGDLIDQNLVNRLTVLARDAGNALPECWKGPVAGQETWGPGCSPPNSPVTGDLEIIVRDDGTFTGSVTERRERGFLCEAIGGVAPMVPALEQTYVISGRKTAGAFELEVYGEVITLPIVGTHATGTFHATGLEITYTIDCMTCG